MRATGSLRLALVTALLFGSGLSALIYQTAWQREFRLIFGSSTAASAAVLTLFIGGMGAGGLFFGRRADVHQRPLSLYAGLELVIAAFAAVTPPLLTLARAAYLRLGGSVTLGIAGGTALRLALAALVLAVPTFVMGGTLPAAARSVERAADTRRRVVGLLYGANTLGAVTGCALATFSLLERLGTRGSLWAACAANAAVALIAAATDRALPAPPSLAPASPALPAPERERDPLAPAAPAAPRGFVFAAAAIVGFAFFLMELVWYRLLGPLLGGTIFTFGLILATALLGIGLGGLGYALFGGRRPAHLRGFALTCLLEALGLAVPFALGDRIALLALALRPDGGANLTLYLPGWIAIAALVVLPASLVAGAQYPLLIALLGQGSHDVGRQIGAAAACNTVGAMVGSLAGGFLLLPALSAPGCFRTATALLLALGLAAFGLAAFGLAAERLGARAPSEAPASQAEGPAAWAPRPGRLVRRFALLLIGAGALACLVTTGPTAVWRHSSIGVGRVERSILASPNAARAWVNDVRRGILWEAEGLESSVALDATDGLAMVVNGKVDGNARGDAPTQVMGGLLGAWLHPHPTRAMVIGLGTGSTAGWLAAVPSIERVDVAELEASMRHVAAACAPVNHDVLTSPKVHLLFGDARETLLTIPARYDVIFSEPSNPYRAGVASLFTREYYQAVAARLAEGGLFVQWVQMYEIDFGTIKTLYATLGAVFPTVETWRLGSSDLVLIASKDPVAHDAAALRQRAAEEPYRSALGAAWRTEGLEGVLAHHVARPATAPRLAEGAAVNTDDRNRVEFAFARHVGDFARVDAVLDAARAHGEERPAIDGEVDWTRVEEERLMQIAAEGIEPEIPKGLAVDQEVRVVAAINYVSGNLAGALAKWEYQTGPPVGLTELDLVAEGLADAGREEARAMIDRLRALQPIEADAMLARLAFRQGKRDEAAALLERAFVAHRSDPWPSPAVMHRSLGLALDLAKASPALAARLAEVLAEPFAVRCLEGARKLTAQMIAQKVPDPAVCDAAWHALEPHVPWELEGLGARLDCYREAHDERQEPARVDLEAFLSCGARPGWLRCL